MTTDIQNDTDQSARRRQVTRILARYPGISEDDLQQLLHYFRNEASALDRGTIASIDEVRAQYARFCEDHRLDRLRFTETALVIVFAVGLLTVVTFLLLGR